MIVVKSITSCRDRRWHPRIYWVVTFDLTVFIVVTTSLFCVIAGDIDGRSSFFEVVLLLYIKLS